MQKCEALKVKRLKKVDIELQFKLKNAKTLALDFQSVNLILSGYRKCKPKYKFKSQTLSMTKLMFCYLLTL